MKQNSQENILEDLADEFMGDIQCSLTPDGYMIFLFTTKQLQKLMDRAEQHPEGKVILGINVRQKVGN